MNTQSIELSLDRPTGNLWIDTGLVVLIQEFGEGTHNPNVVLQWLLDKIVQPTKNKEEYFDQQTQQLCQYQKRNWVYPLNLFIKVSGKSDSKVTINGKRYPTQPPVFKLDVKDSKRPGLCDLCGDTAPFIDAKMLHRS